MTRQEDTLDNRRIFFSYIEKVHSRRAPRWCHIRAVLLSHPSGVYGTLRQLFSLKGEGLQ